MPITSISLFRHRTPPFLSSTSSLRRHRFFSISASTRQNPNISRKFQPQQPSKNLLKARETVKHFSTLSPVLSQDEKLQLSHNQAIGMVSSSQANFMRVIIQSPPPEGSISGVADVEGSRSSGVQFSQLEASNGNRGEFVQLEGSRSSGKVSGVQFSQLEGFSSCEEVSNGKRDEFVQVETSRSFVEVSGGQFLHSEGSSSCGEVSNGNRGEFVQLEGSRSSGKVSGVESSHSEASRSSGKGLKDNQDEFVELEGSRSSGKVSGVEFSHSEASPSFKEDSNENQGEFDHVEGSRSLSKGLNENRDEFVDVEASRSFRKGLNGNRGEFVELESSRSSVDVSGVQSRDEVDEVEGSRSSFEAPIEKLERNGGGIGNEGKRVGVELLCVVKAVLKKIKRRVLVGDKVLVGSIDWIDRRGMIENVFERKSEVLDPPVANVDHLVVLFSMDQPKIEPFALTRFLVEAESIGIPFFLALNKSELVDEETLFAWKARLRNWGYNPVFCSIESKRGLDTLQFRLREQTSVIVGPSGVGKSSLINALRGNNPILGVQQDDNWADHILGSKWLEEQRVGEISMRSGRGKHTTRHVSLLPLTGGGYLADTPGFNQPSLIKVTKQSLASHFPEIRKMLEDSEHKKCSFNNCLHIGEPGCVVKGDWERYPYYFQLLDEIRIREEFQLRTLGTKREGDVRYKTGELGVVQAEPRLEPKKHRRVSRKKAKQSIMDGLDEYDDDKDLLDENPVIRAVREEQQ